MRLNKIMKASRLAMCFYVFSLSNLFAQVEDPVRFKMNIEKLENSTYELIFEAEIDDKWHLYGQYFDLGGPRPLYFSFDENENYRLIDSVAELGDVIHEYDDVFEVNVAYFAKQAKFVQKIEVLTDKGFNITGEISGQACYDDGACVTIGDDILFEINGGASIENQETIEAKTPVIVKENKFASSTEEKSSLLGFFFLSFLFGIIGILTPCVFPMIPMTISVFMNKSEKRSRGILKAIIFGLSITLLYTLVGVIVSLTSAGANFTTVLSTHWIPNLIFFVLFLVFAASLFGLFEMVLPSGLANKADAQVDKGGMLSAFFMALTTVIVSFSCTGPIIGALLVEAASGNVLEPLIGMFGFGLGFALPFTFLALVPRLISKLPKSGGWLNAVKVVMGFILLAFSLKYFSNIDQNYHLGILSRDVYLAIWIVIFVLLGIYLLGKIKFSHDSDVQHIGFFRMLLAMVSFVFVIYLVPGLFGANLTPIAGLLPPKTSQKFDLTAQKSSSSESVGYYCESPDYADVLHMAYNVNGYFDYEQAFECAKSQNLPVLLYFTGHSCSNCKKMQAEIWSDPTINDYFNNKLVVAALYVDEKSIELPKEKWFSSSKDNKLKKKLGDANADIQIVNFNTNTQPYYVLISPDGKVLAEPMTYELNPEKFLNFLNKGIEEFENPAEE